MEETFKDKIRTRRLELGLSQEKTAQALGITVRNYHKWESGEGYPSFSGLVALCLLFNVTADYFLGLCDQPIPLQKMKKKEETDQ